MKQMQNQERPGAAHRAARTSRPGSIANLTWSQPIGYFYAFLATFRSSMSAAFPPASFEAALQELERIVQAMESGDAPLEESLANYERGMALLKTCQERLAAAEQKIRMLENGGLRDFPGGTD